MINSILTAQIILIEIKLLSYTLQQSLGTEYIWNLIVTRKNEITATATSSFECYPKMEETGCVNALCSRSSDFLMSDIYILQLPQWGSAQALDMGRGLCLATTKYDKSLWDNGTRSTRGYINHYLLIHVLCL